MYSTFKYEGPNSLPICRGVISRGGHFCVKRGCTYSSHQAKVWESRWMEEGFYILEAVGLKAYLEPCLTMMEANRLSTSRETLGDGKKTKEVWAAIFRHL